MNQWQSKADWKDRNWKYVAASKTDISKTIARVKRELKELAEQPVVLEKVTNIRKVANKK